MTDLLCLCSAPVTLPVLPFKSPSWKPPTLSDKNLVFFMPSADLLNSTFRERQFVYMNKKTCFN